MKYIFFKSKQLNYTHFVPKVPFLKLPKSLHFRGRLQLHYLETVLTHTRPAQVQARQGTSTERKIEHGDPITNQEVIYN